MNYLNNILAKIEANDAGVPEAIMLNHEGNVAECTGDNIFIVQKQQVQTPTTADGILEGITRKVVIDLCKKLGIACVEKTLQRHDLYIADECFLTGSAAEVVPVTKIDGRSVGEGHVGQITRKLMDAFGKHIRANSRCCAAPLNQPSAGAPYFIDLTPCRIVSIVFCVKTNIWRFHAFAGI
jgi:branched-chain amino acid aminotransferase